MVRDSSEGENKVGRREKEREDEADKVGVDDRGCHNGNDKCQARGHDC